MNSMKPREMKTLLVVCCGLVVMLVVPALLFGGTPIIFQDGFESGDTQNWNNGVKVSWHPEKLDRQLARGEKRAARLYLHIHAELPESELWLTPSLRGVVPVITPSRFPALPAGSKIPVDLILRSDQLGVFEGTLHLRPLGGNRTFARPLGIVVEVKESLEDRLPPEPDPEENNSTLEGVDTNGDGIRDDVERFIALNWADPLEREAMRQYAEGFAKTFFLETRQEAAEDLEQANSCMYAVSGVENAWNSLRSLRIKYLNNLQRSKAYIDYDRSLSGQGFEVPVPGEEDCNFDVENLR